MKHFSFFSGLALWLLQATLLAQTPENITRFTTGVEISAGLASHPACYEYWGNYTIAINTAYRFKRSLSLEGKLQYLHLEGRLSGYSTGTEIQLSGFQQWNNISLQLGPSLHIQTRKGREWSLNPKIGLMLNQPTQELFNFGIPYQNRQYKAALLPVYGGDFRLSWWLNKRVAFETAFGFTQNLNAKKALKINSITDFPGNSSNPEIPSGFLDESAQFHGQLLSINMLLGLRYRL